MKIEEIKIEELKPAKYNPRVVLQKESESLSKNKIKHRRVWTCRPNYC